VLRKTPSNAMEIGSVGVRPLARAST